MKDEYSKSYKLAEICTKIAGILCMISVAPLVIAIFVILIGLLGVLLSGVMYLLLGIIWVFSAGLVNLFSLAAAVGALGLGIFDFLPTWTGFCFQYITPIASWVSIVVAVIGIVLCILAIIKESKIAKEMKAKQEENPVVTSPSPTRRKRRRRKLSNATKCVGFLILCIVYTLISLVAAFFALGIIGSL